MTSSSSQNFFVTSWSEEAIDWIMETVVEGEETDNNNNNNTTSSPYFIKDLQLSTNINSRHSFMKLQKVMVPSPSSPSMMQSPQLSAAMMAMNQTSSSSQLSLALDEDSSLGNSNLFTSSSTGGDTQQQQQPTLFSVLVSAENSLTGQILRKLKERKSFDASEKADQLLALFEKALTLKVFGQSVSWLTSVKYALEHFGGGVILKIGVDPNFKFEDDEDIISTIERFNKNHQDQENEDDDNDDTAEQDHFSSLSNLQQGNFKFITATSNNNKDTSSMMMIARRRPRSLLQLVTHNNKQFVTGHQLFQDKHADSALEMIPSSMSKLSLIVPPPTGVPPSPSTSSRSTTTSKAAAAKLLALSPHQSPENKLTPLPAKSFVDEMLNKMLNGEEDNNSNNTTLAKSPSSTKHRRTTTTATTVSAFSSSSIPPLEKQIKQDVFVFPIVIGSVAKHRGREATNDQPFEWKIYVRGPHFEDLSHVVEKVVFRLHHTFANPIRVVDKAPFELVDYGWGQFVIGIDVHFLSEYEGHNNIINNNMNNNSSSNSSAGTQLNNSCTSGNNSSIMFDEASGVIQQQQQQAGGSVNTSTSFFNVPVPTSLQIQENCSSYPINYVFSNNNSSNAAILDTSSKSSNNKRSSTTTKTSSPLMSTSSTGNNTSFPDALNNSSSLSSSSPRSTNLVVKLSHFLRFDKSSQFSAAAALPLVAHNNMHCIPPLGRPYTNGAENFMPDVTNDADPCVWEEYDELVFVRPPPRLKQALISFPYGKEAVPKKNTVSWKSYIEKFGLPESKLLSDEAEYNALLKIHRSLSELVEDKLKKRVEAAISSGFATSTSVAGGSNNSFVGSNSNSSNNSRGWAQWRRQAEGILTDVGMM